MNKLVFNSFKKRINIRREEVVYDDIPFDTSETQLRYRIEGTEKWTTKKGIAMNVPDTNRVVHTVNLEGLNEETGYEFQMSLPTNVVYLTLKDDPTSTMVIHWQTFKPFTKKYITSFSSKIHKFKTAPSVINGKTKIAQISDTHSGNKHISKMIEWLGKHDPLVVIHSGDVATGNGGENRSSTFYSFFESVQFLRSTEGYIIPMSYNLGNHETWSGSGGIQYGTNDTGIKPNFETGARGDTEWYYCFFPSFIDVGYGKLTFGDYLSVWQLDPGISTRTDEGQSDWLAQTLQEDTNPNQFVSLHYGMWPGGRRAIEGTVYTEAVRKDFLPIVEEHYPVIFYGHDHVMSWSPPIKGGTIQESGVDYEEGIYHFGSGTPGLFVSPARNAKTKWWLDGAIGDKTERFNFEKRVNNAEYREPHEDDGEEFDWKEGNHYWIVEFDYLEKDVIGYNGHNEEVVTVNIQNK